jgi:phospholipid-binding lipoprotein MlaA
VAAAEAPEPQLAGGPLPGEASAAPQDAAVSAEGPPAPDAVASAAIATSSLPPASPPSPRSGRDADADSGEIPDPLQRLNRPMFHVDQAVRRVVLSRASAPRPPRPVRQGLGQAIANLDEPGNMANQLLQRKPGKALRTAARFLINSTLGVAGLFDVARKVGLKPSHADFGQTLASYGVGPGAYLYVPIRGSTSVRDVVGAVVDTYFWPLHWARVGLGVQQAVVLARLETQPRRDPGFRYARADQPSAARHAAGPPVDAYVAARRFYAMQREAQIRDRVPAGEPVLAGGPILAGGPQVTVRRHRKLTLQLISARELAPASGS